MELASDKPAPASGSASAAVVAAAAALLEKCAQFSIAQMSDAVAVCAAAHALRRHAEMLVERDTLAFMRFLEARRAARGLKGRRRAEMLEAASAATVESPLQLARTAAQVFDLAEKLAQEGNPNLRADAVIAGLLCATAAQAGAVLVRVNLEGSVAAMTADSRLDEAERLERRLRTRARRLAAPTPAGGRGRARARSAGSARR